MQVTFLGTGTSSGVPLIGCQCAVCQSLDYRDKRLRVSVLIETQGKSFVIDTGPDFRQQMLRERVSQLDAVLFTHQHKDHTAGLDDVRAFNFLQRQDMPVYARSQVLDQLKAEFAYVFADKKYPGIPRIQLHEITNQPFCIEGVTFVPIDAMHHNLPVFGFRVGDFAYLTDINFVPDHEMYKLNNLAVLVIGALQIEPHISHFTLSQALDFTQKVGAKQTYFTHISHKLGSHKEVSKHLPDTVLLAQDGLRLRL